jgi:small-conductance mechanosensitive channel
MLACATESIFVSGMILSTEKLVREGDAVAVGVVGVVGVVV